MSTYVIAVKRERREDVTADWSEALRDAPGVEVTGESGGRRVTVRATDDGIDELRSRVGAFCHIEPLIEHEPLAPSDPSPTLLAPPPPTDPIEP